MLGFLEILFILLKYLSGFLYKIFLNLDKVPEKDKDKDKDKKKKYNSLQPVIFSAKGSISVGRAVFGVFP